MPTAVRRCAAALVLVGLAAACTAPADGPSGARTGEAATAAPDVSPSQAPPDRDAPAPTTARDVDQQLTGRLAAAAAAFAPEVRASVAVLDAEGAPVFSLHGDRPQLPASTAKLLPGAAALALWGAEHRFTTGVDLVGTVEDGVVDGRLELVGGGDPALVTEDYRTLVYVGRPHTPIEELADEVVAAGVRLVRGGIVAAPDAFGDDPEAPGWKPVYLSEFDARRIHALTVDAGLDVTVLEQPPDPVLELLQSPDPVATTVRRFTDALRARGVVVLPARPGVDGADADDGAVSRERLAEVASDPLVDHVRFAFERSDNHTADTLLRGVGASLGARDWLGSGRAVASVLRELGIDTTGLSLADGSGLSRDDRVTATTLAAVDQRLRAGRHGASWRDALAVAGEEGTLRRRLLGTVAEGRFLGKSGTLDDVTALAGTVEGPDGAAAYHLAAMVTVPPGSSRFPARVVIDDLVALLAEHAAGCTREPPPPEVAEDEFVVGGLYVVCP